jgi:peptidoglycan hydrolase CwlO-like protein
MLYKDQELTEEQALQELATRDSNITDLTAERDSLSERLQALQAQADKLQAELTETKKLNYTLAAQIPAKHTDTADDFFKEVLKR